MRRGGVAEWDGGSPTRAAAARAAVVFVYIVLLGGGVGGESGITATSLLRTGSLRCCWYRTSR